MSQKSQGILKRSGFLVEAHLNEKNVFLSHTNNNSLQILQTNGFATQDMQHFGEL